jgi:hypothetical protein
MATNYTYSYTPGDGTSVPPISRLRYLLGDHRGVPATYTQATWLTTANALHTDEELTDVLLMTVNDLMSACRICLQSRLNREAQQAGVAGTTDTTDRPKVLAIAAEMLGHMVYPIGDTLPISKVTTNVAIDAASLTDLGDDT